MVDQDHKARQTAQRVAKKNGFDDSAPRLLDTNFPQQFPCYLIAPGLVVYEDDPDCVVSVEHIDGRFIQSQAA